MGIWFMMLGFNLLIPAIMLGAGKLFLKKAPKDIYWIFGYRTTMSMKNADTWAFAHIFFYYFDDLTGNESADEIKNRLIMDDPELVSLLEKTALKERIFDALSELVEMYSEETGRSREELIDAISQMNFHDPEQLKKEMMELFGITEWPDDM